MPKPSISRTRKHRMLAAVDNFLDMNEDNDADDEEDNTAQPEMYEVQGNLEDQSLNEMEINNDNDELVDSEGPNSIHAEDADLSSEDNNQNSEESNSDLTDSEEENVYLDGVELLEDEPDEVKQLRVLAVTKGMDQNTINEMLKIFRRRLLPQLPKSAKTFLGTSSAVYDIKEMQDSDGSIGEYVYFGIQKGLQECIDPNVHKKSTIFVQFNIDGISLTKSGEKGFWVMSGKVHYQPDIYKSFAVLIYSGNSKPASLDEYLGDFIVEVNKLQANGVTIMEQRFNFRIHCFICDTPARAFIKGTKGHTGFYSCERCTIKGLKEDRVTHFPLANCPERTDESFRSCLQPPHHNRESPLLRVRPFINMISMFVLDFMHLFCEGIMKRLLMSWFVLPGYAKVGQQLKMEVNRRLLLVRKCIPCEFQRKTRPLTSLKKWKATEFRFILLYCGPVILLNILDRNRFKNFLLLHTASRILCNDKLCKKYQQHAKIYLRHFFLSLRGLYSKMLVLNIHCSIHVADDVLAMGCSLTRLCAFTFENYLGKLTSLIQSANRPLAQICRRLHELNKLDPPKPQIPYKVQILKCVESNVLKLKYKECILTTKFPNNFVLLKNKLPFEIMKMTRAQEGVEIEGKVWSVKRSLFIFPTDSKDLYMWELQKKANDQLLSFNVTYVKCKMIKLIMNLQEGFPMRVYCMPLLHHS